MKTERASWVTWTTIGTVALVGAGCGDDLGPARYEGRIAGTVALAAASTDDLSPSVQHNTLTIAAFYGFPPTAPPIASLTVSASALLAGDIAYELRGMPSNTYRVVAGLGDLTQPGAAEVMGGFPSMCALWDTRSDLVVAEGQTRSGVDLTLHGGHGALDPCYAQTTVPACSNPGAGSLSLTLDSFETAREGDTLTVALFHAWPVRGQPAAATMVHWRHATFPLTVVINAVPVGDYALYACLDRGTNNTMSICDGEDTWAVVGDGALVALAANRVTHATLNLSTGGGAAAAPTACSP